MKNTTEPPSEAEQLQRLRTLTRSGAAAQIRERANLSQAEIGRSIHIDPSTVGRWERGERNPRGEAALRYAALLDLLDHAAQPSAAA